MHSRLRNTRSRTIMFRTLFPLKTANGTFTRYCTYGKRFTIHYLHCLLLGHGPVIYREPIITPQGVITTYMAKCCDRRFYP